MNGRKLLLFLAVLIEGPSLHAQPAGERSVNETAAESAAPPRLFGGEAPTCRRLGPPPGAHPPCFGALTPEERRQLRRDIRQAGQELYFPRPIAPPHLFGGPPLQRRE